MAGMTVSGLVSGLDTQTIIAQLMQAERQPQVALQTKQATLRNEAKAYQGIESLLSTMQDAAGALASSSGWQAFTATSSSSAVTASAGADSMIGSVTFTVDRLATAASQVSANAVPSTNTIVATGPLTLTVGGTAHTVNVGDGSLASVVTAINAAGLGVRAAAVQVSTGSYKLQLTANTTGAASSFTVDPAALDPSLGGLNVLDAGQDAQVTVGGGLVVSSATNTVSGLMPGLSVQLAKADPATPVTVTVGRDGSALADKIDKMVQALNAALSEIATQTAYDPTSKQAGPLLSDFAVRELQQTLLETVPGMSAAGVSLTKDGKVTFDKTVFANAYAADPNGIAALFERSGTSTDPQVSLLNASDTTRAGVYDVNVTQAAQQAGVTGSAFAGGTLAADETISVRVGTTVVSYAATTGQTATDVATGLNQALAGAGLGLAATVVGGAVRIQSADYGSGVSFDVQTSGTGTGLTSAAGAWETHSGVDVAGTMTVNGSTVAMTGVGQVLFAPATDPTVGGLSLKVTATAPMTATFTYAPGLAQRLSTIAYDHVTTNVGKLELARQSDEDAATALDDQISQWDVRLALRQTELQRQFSSLETALSQMKSQSSWLAGQLSGLSNG